MAIYVHNCETDGLGRCQFVLMTNVCTVHLLNFSFKAKVCAVSCLLSWHAMKILFTREKPSHSMLMQQRASNKKITATRLGGGSLAHQIFFSD